MKEHKYLNNNNPRKKTVRKFRFIGTLILTISTINSNSKKVIVKLLKKTTIFNCCVNFMKVYENGLACNGAYPNLALALNFLHIKARLGDHNNK